MLIFQNFIFRHEKLCCRFSQSRQPERSAAHDYFMPYNWKTYNRINCPHGNIFVVFHCGKREGKLTHSRPSFTSYGSNNWKRIFSLSSSVSKELSKQTIPTKNKYNNTRHTWERLSFALLFLAHRLGCDASLIFYRRALFLTSSCWMGKRDGVGCRVIWKRV